MYVSSIHCITHIDLTMLKVEFVSIPSSLSGSLARSASPCSKESLENMNEICVL